VSPSTPVCSYGVPCGYTYVNLRRSRRLLAAVLAALDALRKVVQNRLKVGPIRRLAQPRHHGRTLGGDGVADRGNAAESTSSASPSAAPA
jgi:hypothetical protein